MADLFVIEGALKPSTAHIARTSLVLVRTSAGSSQSILRLLPATGHDSEILDTDNPDLGYDAENSPYQQTEREMRVICSAWS
jgi:hypothetical protein